MAYNKIEYTKPPTFPSWSRIKPELADKRVYYPDKNGIKAEFEGNNCCEHSNHIEMAGFYCSSIISYRLLKGGSFELYRFVVFPSIRVNPNNTHGSLCEHFEGVDFLINNESETLLTIEFNGILNFYSRAGGAKIKRSIYPAANKKALIEEIEISCNVVADIEIKNASSIRMIDACFTPYSDDIELKKKTYMNDEELSDSTLTLKAGTTVITIVYSAEDVTQKEAENEKNKRIALIADNSERLKITTPDADINLEILLSKLRASESIFKTKGGLMHSPGGGNYYAALWTNDQCEYANPLFAYLGYEAASKQSLNCFDLFSKLASEDKAVYTSICAEGDDFWNGAGDRGDTSMFVYGFSRYLLTTGDNESAKKYLPSLERACTYIESKINKNGVVESDSDELENRFESGNANLSTAVISYDAFISMAYLEKELNNDEKSKKYYALSKLIKKGIKNYFEAEVEGFETYRYCAEETRLRSWICLPLTVGINNRVQGTISALKSEKLKKPCGLLTRSGEETYWDRSLLYALRGMFYSGRADDALDMLKEYTFSRLYCGHTPYPFEAFPEGNGAHLSAESALYVRIFTEGVLGFRPTGFNKFELKPSLPSQWNHLKIENFVYSKRPLSIEIFKENDRYRLIIKQPDIEIWLKENEITEICTK